MPSGEHTGKQEVQRVAIVIPLVGPKAYDIQGRNVAPKIFLPPVIYSHGSSNKGRVSILLNPVGTPSFLAQSRPTICFVTFPVRLLALPAAILEAYFRTRVVALQNGWAHATYCQEIAVSTSISADFRAVRVVRVPVGTEERWSCHVHALEVKRCVAPSFVVCTGW